VPDDSDEDIPAPKRKRSRKTQSKPVSSSPPQSPIDNVTMDLDDAADSTAQQWKFDPNDPNPMPHTRPKPAKSSSHASSAKKAKAHTTEPEQRHTWLAQMLDADKHPPDHPDYDPRTLYIPPHALSKLSAFEQQYWKIKKNLMDTVVFFKKGKFYELYEMDATIGHQMFDLKLTDRVNMRMVGVPESSLDLWANQFVAKGYKIARVDQIESALAKEMRERDDPKAKPTPKNKDDKTAKVVRRELTSVLTAGTLVEGSMLQDDMATYCAAVKVCQMLSLRAL